ncbi:MAG: M15 family metallopeptidase [Burkholderiales bacterium]|jgi:peptidoglycan LD-endopeptidase CwlK|nr:M15 family metallopeptidase [Burkholderiales bacterium]
MILVVLVAYFAIVCLLAGLMLLPTFRRRTATAFASALRNAAKVGHDANDLLEQRARERAGQAGTFLRTGARLLRDCRAHALIGLALLALPPLLVFSVRDFRSLDAFTDEVTPSISGGVVSALLEGEQLVPPPPLPPEVFMTPEVERLRPQLSNADRRWDLMDREFRQRLLLVYKVMRDEHGYDMVLLEGYRSPERQALLAKMGTNVTNAGAWQSYHQYGLAADSAFLRDGKLVISERDPWAMKGYELYGEAAQRAGLTWGGRWQNMDFGHVELRGTRPPRPNVGG